MADDLPGTAAATVGVAVDASNRLFFDNQMVDERQLKAQLHDTVRTSREQLTLVIHADRSVTYEELLRLTQLARGPEIGITNILLATLPSATATPATK